MIKRGYKIGRFADDLVILTKSKKKENIVDKLILVITKRLPIFYCQ